MCRVGQPRRKAVRLRARRVAVTSRRSPRTRCRTDRISCASPWCHLTGLSGVTAQREKNPLLRPARRLPVATIVSEQRSADQSQCRPCLSVCESCANGRTQNELLCLRAYACVCVCVRVCTCALCVRARVCVGLCARVCGARDR